MKYLLFQSDDYGITNGVSDGILYGIKNGVVRNTGLFVNMASSKLSAQKIKDIPGIDVGIDINYVAGYPVSDINEVKSLVDEKGHFIPSTKYIKNNKLIEKKNGLYYFEEDPFNYDEIYTETENQVKKFIELMDRKPAYIHSHSISTPNTAEAALEVAKKYDLISTRIDRNNPKVYQIPVDWTPKSFPVEEQFKVDVKTRLVESLKNSLDHEIGYYICHCGYVDDDLLSETTYTIIRCKDLASAVSKELIDFLKENHIQIITHTELAKLIK